MGISHVRKACFGASVIPWRRFSMFQRRFVFGSDIFFFFFLKTWTLPPASKSRFAIHAPERNSLQETLGPGLLLVSTEFGPVGITSNPFPLLLARLRNETQGLERHCAGNCHLHSEGHFQDDVASVSDKANCSGFHLSDMAPSFTFHWVF